MGEAVDRWTDLTLPDQVRAVPAWTGASQDDLGLPASLLPEQRDLPLGGSGLGL